jgi:hypothetical protein
MYKADWWLRLPMIVVSTELKTTLCSRRDA